MVIVLEGCDCTGKTTFAQELAKRTGYEIVKGSSFEIASLGQDGMFQHMMSLLDRDNIIIDRFFYSNLVYGFLYKYPMMTPQQYMELSIKLNKKGIVIYLQASPFVIKERMASRGDDMIKASEVDKILSEYSNTINGYFMPKMMLSFDTTNSDTRICTAMVGEIINSDLTKTYIKATN
jgi:thymidylate kinase